jgi:integrase/recombinase XerD
LGEPVPAWRKQRATPALPPLLSDYAGYRTAHNGTAETTLRKDLDTARRFLLHLRGRRRPLKGIGLRDIDAFVQAVAARVSTSTVADTCSSLRAFLRFLQMSGRLNSDLASGVMAPRFRASARPPRTLPWCDVKRILRAVRTSDHTGRRDFAMLLLLTTYGLGAAEILALRLEDLDWRAGVLRARRPKTKVDIELPLLPAVARALAAYLRWERPPADGIQKVFLSRQMPYAPITGGAIRHRIRLYAKRAGVSAKVLGSHIFRHSHASRQIDAGANLKVVSEILGHRSSSSTSVYVRVALRRLRGVGLPVPR